MADHNNWDIRPAPYPNSDDFRDLLKACGLSQRRFAEIVDVHPNTVTSWAKNGAPHIAMKYLRLRADLKKVLDLG